MINIFVFQSIVGMRTCFGADKLAKDVEAV